MGAPEDTCPPESQARCLRHYESGLGHGRDLYPDARRHRFGGDRGGVLPRGAADCRRVSVGDLPLEFGAAPGPGPGGGLGLARPVNRVAIVAERPTSTLCRLTLPVGDPNTEVSAQVDLLGLPVAAGTVVRWRVVSGPTGPDAAWALALTMEAQSG